MSEENEVEEEVTEVVADVSLGEALEAEFDKQAVSDDVSDETVIETAEADEVTEVTDEVVPPEHWSKEDQQVFMDMDESGREWALRLETNAHKGIEEKSIELKQFRDAIEPYKHLIPPGQSEGQVIQNLMNAQNILQQNPTEGLKWLARSYGVDEKQFAATDIVPEDDTYVDPEVRKLKEEVTQLTRRSEQDLQTANNRRQQQIFAEINQFKDAVDEDGTVLHPHFASVQGVIAGLLQSGRVSDMDAAYEQAVWAVPEYRDSVIEKQAKERADKELADKTADADKARKAAATVQGKSSSRETKAAATLGDSLSANYEKSIRGEL